MTGSYVLHVVVCGAGPAGHVGTLIHRAQAGGHRVQVIATPAALDFLNVEALEDLTGLPVRHSYRRADQPRQSAPTADAVIVAPATFNTVCKLSAGISDTYALGVLAEHVGAGTPVVVLPFVNTALAARRPWQAAVAQLRAEGVRVLIGADGFQPHPPGTGSDRITAFPWNICLNNALDMIEERQHR